MTRLQRQLVVALSVLAAGGGALAYLWATDISQREARAKAEAEARKLFHFDPEKAQEILLLTRGATLAFAKRSEDWLIQRPVQGMADATAINALLAHLQSLKVEPVEGGTVERYGLAHPRTWVELGVDGSRLRLEVGPKNALDDRYFVTDGARKQVWLAENGFYWTVDRDLDAFRDHHLFPRDAQSIRAVRLWAGAALLWGLEREGPGWQATDGKQRLPADTSEAEMLLVMLTKRLTADRYVTDEAGADLLAHLELSPPARTLEVETADGQKLRVHLGRLDDSRQEKHVSLLLDGTRTVAEGPGWVQKDLSKTLATLRDRAIARFEVGQVQRLVLRRPREGVTVTVDRAGEGWSIAGKPARAHAVEALLVTLSRLRASEIYWEQASEAELARGQLDQPQGVFEVQGAEGRALTEVRVGKAISPKELLIYNPSTRRAGTYAQSLMELLPKKAEELSAQP